MVDCMHSIKLSGFCAVKLGDKTSEVNLRGRTSFTTELESTKLPIDDSMRMCMWHFDIISELFYKVFSLFLPQTSLCAIFEL